MNNQMNNTEYKDDLLLVNGGIMRLVSRPQLQSWSIHYYDDQMRHHNEHGPAINHNNRTKMWFVNGIRHREDGPAVRSSVGEIWYRNGLIHRIDGPAQTHFENQTKQYYLYGNGYTKREYNKIMFRVNTACNIFKKKLRKTYTHKLQETNICDEKALYSIISSYII